MAGVDGEKIATLVQVANLYYNEGLSQREIADKLGVSRSLIALYLQKARDQQIVKIEIINPQDTCANLALELRNQTGIPYVEVVPHGHISQELTRRAIAAAAAQFLENRIEDGDVLGMAWGRTITRVVELLAPTRPRDIDVIPLLGESSYTGSYSQMNQLVLQTAQHFGGRPHFLLAPVLVGSKSLRDMLYEDLVVQPIAKQWDHLTIACFGIGVLPPIPGMITYIGEENSPLLQVEGAVGDVCVYPYSAEGEILPTVLSDRMIGVSIDQLCKARCRLAVAAGAEKALAVVGALRANLVTSLIVDAQLAAAAIDYLTG